jgi:hypothetical protein
MTKAQLAATAASGAPGLATERATARWERALERPNEFSTIWCGRQINPIPRTNAGGAADRDAAEWFRHRSYDYREFSDLEKLGLRKRELSLTVSAKGSRECLT